MTINTHRGLFRYKKLPFGVTSVPGIYLIDNLVKDIPHICAYLDDILLTGTYEAVHFQILSRVLTCLEDARLKLKEAKCTFLADSVEYLGFRLVNAVNFALPLKNVSHLHSFLRPITHFNRFIPQSAATLRPLYR